jgi:P pilus assembly chaperone PapD
MKILKHSFFAQQINWRKAPLVGLAVLVASASTPAYANGLLLAPTRLFFEGSSRTQELTIMNQSDKTQTYRLRLEDRRLKDTGEYDVITEPGDPTAASSMLRLSARQIVIPPRSSGTVRVLLRKPAGLPSGEVRSHLIVTELPSVGAPFVPDGAATEITVSITTIYGISIPVLVRTGELNARITSVSATRIVPPENPELENVVVEVNATGNRSVFVDVRLISTRQRRSEPIALAKSFALYAPLGPRKVTLSLNAEQTARARAGGVVVQYQEVNRDGTPVGAVSEIAF